MIQYSDIESRMESFLDAEGSERYLFEQDYKPAVNSAIEWLVSAFNSVFSQNKLSEEVLRDLVFTEVWQTSNFSRVSLDSTGGFSESIWSILGVFPYPEVDGTNQTPIPVVDDHQSVYRPDLTYISADFAAAKLTIEQWNRGRLNIFQPGNDTVQNGLQEYGYLNIGNYPSNQNQYERQIEIRPKLKQEFVAISYLKYPDLVSQPTDSIEFPLSLTTLLVEKALNFISIKQGDNTTLNSITENEVARLTQIMS